KNYHANRLKALVYRISDYLSIAYALRVADRVWTPSQPKARPKTTATRFPNDILNSVPRSVRPAVAGR
ncbi:hypothetical protein ACV35N_32645, partial [Pseudomonas aeruginosa]